MSLQSDLIAPITVDLRAEDLSFNIIKGIEDVKYMDLKQDDTSAAFAPGSWVVTTATGAAVVPGGNGPANVYPVLVGNDQSDSLATGHLTVAVGGGFLAETTKFVAASYTVGGNLTVKSTGLQTAGMNDAIVARVWAYDSDKQVLTILVLNR